MENQKRRMAKINLDIIAEATRKLRIIIGLSNIMESYKLFSLITFINSIGGCCLLIYSFYHFRHSSDDLAGVAYNFGLLNGVVVGSVSGHLGKIKLFKIVDDSYFTYDYQSSIMKKKIEELEKPRAKALKRFFKTLLILTYAAQANLTGLTVLIGMIKKEEIYLFPCWHPFDLSNILSQIFLLAWQQFIILGITFVAFGCWGILYITYSHIKTEISLLDFAIRNISSRAREMMQHRESVQKGEDYDKILLACYKQCTRMCAEHHSEIIRFFTNGQDFIGIFYTTAFISGGSACTFGGYYISSFFTIAQTVYTLEWYNLPKECQSTLRLMQIRSNHPLFYKLVLGQRVDMEAYMSLVKATYYYLNIIIT
ncbi:uncharacterized protein [Halyomorpha halys]|uniref:uncharacterized protein isoform X2 n=1 Tax=Halyomorpha halys TaxID=286706 RepID=UPI0006D4DF1C